MLEYGDKIIEVFIDGIFSSERLKKSDDAAYDRVLEDVNNFIQKIESTTEKVNLNQFEDFFNLSSPDDYAKMLINTKNPDKNKEIVAKIKDKISDLKDRIKKISEIEKKNADDTSKIIGEILDYNNKARKIFLLASKVDKEKPEPKTGESIAKRVKLKKGKIAEIEEEEKNINHELFKKYFTNYRSVTGMYKKLYKRMMIKYIQSKKC